MMDFGYSDQQNSLKELASKILEKNTKKNLIKDLENSTLNFHKKLWNDFSKAGLLGASFRNSLGGSDLGFTEANIILEQLGYHIVNIPFIQTIISTGMPIDKFGSRILRETLIPKIVSGDTILTIAFLEPENEDIKNPNCKLKEIRGVKTITGIKTCVSYGKEADFILIPCKKNRELYLILIDTKSQGLKFNKLESTTREPQYLVELIETTIDDKLILASGSKAQDVADWITLRTTTAICSLAVGVAQASLDLTVSYTKERKAFKRTIASFQAVSHRAADCYIDLACLRLVTEQAVSLLDLEKDANEEVSIAKIWCGDVAHRISHASQHLHGGIGVDRDYLLYRYCLWAKQLELMLGSSTYHLNNVGTILAQSN